VGGVVNFACSVDGCDRDSRANGMCGTHDRQVKRTGTTSPIRPRRKPAEKSSHPVRCGGCGQIVGNATSETTAQTVLRNHRCQPAPAVVRERKPVMPLPLKAVPDKPARPHPRELVDHPSRQIARAAKRVMDAVAALDKAWAADAEKAELRGYRDRLKAELAQGEGLRAPVGPLHWAGAETATVNAGYMDGAISSGIRAANEITARN